MRLGDLLPGSRAAAEVLARDVATVTADSRNVAPGALFFAVAGAKADGLSFAEEAARKGAVAIVADRQPSIALSAPVVEVADVRAALAHAAARLHPRQPGVIAAVTGTSGKTSVAAFLRQIWKRCGHAAASLGTIGLVTPDGGVYGSLTTPDPVTLHETLDRIAGEGVTHLAMEASSHGLDQRRLDGVRLSAAGFTNLSRDHLDYHADLDDYLAAKLRLFDTLLPLGATAVIDADSDVARKVAEAARAHGCAVFTVGRQGDGIKLESAEADAFVTNLVLMHEHRRYTVRLPLAGAFQVSNALVAAGLAIATGESAANVFAALETLEGASGRLERIGERNGAGVFVDYAHKPDALAKVLATLRPLTRKNLVVAFGCGGDRDRGKRPLMGEIAARDADIVYVTDDNPRSENPAAIRREILAGMQGGSAKIVEIGDRRAAIEAAVAALGDGDILVVAGKGHETGQIVGSQILPFSDHEAIRTALAHTKRGRPVSEELWSSLGLVKPLNARVVGRLGAGAIGVSIDTRTLQPGDLFVALKGDNSDGHDHVRRAFEAGAVAAIVDEDHAAALKGAGRLYVVHDTLRALKGLGQAARDRTRARIAAVTGSVGKTTTKEMLRHILSGQGATHASVASYNNHWGVPLTLARMPAATKFGVFEIGMNHAGEITPLVAMVQPHIAIVTRIAPVHLEYLGSIEAIAEAKAEIFSGVIRGGAAILNRDDDQFEFLRERALAGPVRFVIGFGAHEKAEARLASYDEAGGRSRIEADILGRRVAYTLGMPGRHIAINSLAALLAARALGGDVDAAAASLADFGPPAGRGARERLARDDRAITLIDESYNANPVSMAAALGVLGGTPRDGSGRRIAVLGDMLELGPQGADLHAALADEIMRNDIDLVFAAGPLMRHLYDTVPESRRGGYAPDAAQLEPIVAEALADGDIVMIKGSNGSRMATIVARLRRDFAPDQQAAEA